MATLKAQLIAHLNEDLDLARTDVAADRQIARRLKKKGQEPTEMEQAMFRRSATRLSVLRRLAKRVEGMS